MKKLFFVVCAVLIVYATHLSYGANQEQDRTQQQLRAQIQTTIIEQVNRVSEKLLLVAPTILPEKIELPRFFSFTTVRPLPPPVLRPPFVEMKGLLKTIASSDKKAELFDNAGNLIARLTSENISFTKFNRLLVHVSGYQIYPLPSTDPSSTPDTTIVPTIKVQRIAMLSPWVEKKGKLVAIVAMIQGTNSTATTANQSYAAGLFDDNGTLVARLVSSTIPLPKYDGKLVEVGGYQVGFSTITDNDSTAATLIPTIDVRKIVLQPLWVTKQGFIKAPGSYISVMSASMPLELPTSDARLYKGTLLDNDGNIIARLTSKSVPFTKYDGLYVEIQGYQYPGVTPVITDLDDSSILPPQDNVSIMPILPLIDVMKIKILYTPPPIETWRGIIKPRVDDSSIAPDALFILVTPNGTVVGYLSAKTNEMMALLKKLSLDYMVAVTGPVYTLSNSTSNIELKMMAVEKIVVLQDLRHIIKMTGEPLVFQVGETVYFNKIADIIRPVFLPLDADSPDPNACCRFLYQKAWDFDTRIYPILADNDATAEIDNDAPIEVDNDIIMPPGVPVQYIQYDYTYDSRLKCMDEPVFEFKQPGIYRITITCEVINENGFTVREESASRIIQVFPQVTISDTNQTTWQEILDLSTDIQKESSTASELMKAAHDTAMAIIRNMK